MRSQKPAVLLVAAALLTAVLPTLLMAQARGRYPQRRNVAPVTRGTQPAATPAVPPAPVEPATPGAGNGAVPKQGYVVMPDRVPAGTAAPPLIPSDPLDRAYWELYDRNRTVTITGKVTKVDWTNPNSYIYLAAEGNLWAVESGFIQFRQSNVTPAIRVDETITVLGYFPKEEPGIELPGKKPPAVAAYLKTNHLLRAGEITTVFGQKLSMGRPPSESEMTERLKCSALGC